MIIGIISRLEVQAADPVRPMIAPDSYDRPYPGGNTTTLETILIPTTHKRTPVPLKPVRYPCCATGATESPPKVKSSVGASDTDGTLREPLRHRRHRKEKIYADLGRQDTPRKTRTTMVSLRWRRWRNTYSCLASGLLEPGGARENHCIRARTPDVELGNKHFLVRNADITKKNY